MATPTKFRRRLCRCAAMATKKGGLIQRLFGSKKTSFDSINSDDSEVAALRVLQSSSTMLARRHTIDVETFRGDTSDKALMAAAGKRLPERHTSDVNYGGIIRRIYSRVKPRGPPIITAHPDWQRQRPTFYTPATTSKPTAKPSAKPPPPRRTASEITISTEDSADADDEQKSNGSFKRRINRRDRLLRFGALCKVDTTQPIVYPTTPETILEYHKAMPFLDENEEWLMVELNEYECLVDGIEIIKIIANHSKFFEVEPDELWEEFFRFVDDVPAYDEVINFDVWQEFRDKKYAC